MFQTEYKFTLPRGYIDNEGNLHRDGIMRLATAADEILPLKDPRVQSNQAYLIIILLSRVVIKLGSVTHINPNVIENLFSIDLSYLQEMYNRINAIEKRAAVCPKCEHEFELVNESTGGSSATP